MNWKWSNVQIRDTIVRECCTVAEAYRRLKEMEQELLLSAESIRIESIRRASVATQAKERWEMTGGLESDRILSETFVAQAESVFDMEQAKYNSDIEAIKFVRNLLNLIYVVLPVSSFSDAEAFQLAHKTEATCRIVRDAYYSLLHSSQVSPELLVAAKTSLSLDKERIMYAIFELQEKHATLTLTEFALLEPHDIIRKHLGEIPLLDRVEINTVPLINFETKPDEFYEDQRRVGRT